MPYRCTSVRICTLGAPIYQRQRCLGEIYGFGSALTARSSRHILPPAQPVDGSTFDMANESPMPGDPPVPASAEGGHATSGAGARSRGGSRRPSLSGNNLSLPPPDANPEVAQRMTARRNSLRRNSLSQEGVLAVLAARDMYEASVTKVPILGPDYDRTQTHTFKPTFPTAQRKLVTHELAENAANWHQAPQCYQDYDSISSFSQIKGGPSLGDGPVLPMAAPLVLSKDLPTPQFAERLYGQRKETKGGSKGGSTETSPPPFRPPPMEERPTPQIHPLGHIPDYLRQRKEELEASPAMHRKQASDEPAKQTHQLGHIPGYIRRRRSNAGMMEEEAKRAAAEASKPSYTRLAVRRGSIKTTDDEGDATSTAMRAAAIEHSAAVARQVVGSVHHGYSAAYGAAPGLQEGLETRPTVSGSTVTASNSSSSSDYSMSRAREQLPAPMSRAHEQLPAPMLCAHEQLPAPMPVLSASAVPTPRRPPPLPSDSPQVPVLSPPPPMPHRAEPPVPTLATHFVSPSPRPQPLPSAAYHNTAPLTSPRPQAMPPVQPPVVAASRPAFPVPTLVTGMPPSSRIDQSPYIEPATTATCAPTSGSIAPPLGLMSPAHIDSPRSAFLTRFSAAPVSATQSSPSKQLDQRSPRASPRSAQAAEAIAWATKAWSSVLSEQRPEDELGMNWLNML